MSQCSLHLYCHASQNRLLIVTLLAVIFVYYYMSYLHYTYVDLGISIFPRFVKKQHSDTHRINVFIQTWCQQRRASLDWERILKPCIHHMEWGREHPGWGVENRTSGPKSFVSFFDVKPAGEFSRFSIQSVTAEGRHKTIGGDSWRVQIRGPSSIPPTVIDHDNGTYEVVFLVQEPGHYRATVILDYSLCDGFRNPPKDWFVKGNAQGKFQDPHVLPGYEKPFLLELLGDGLPIVFTVHQTSFPLLSEILSEYGHPDSFCKEKCGGLYNRNGRWVGDKWETNVDDNITPVLNQPSTLWIYGDSVGQMFHRSILRTTLCNSAFKTCQRTYNWVYNIKEENLTWAKIEWDNQDFNKDRILTELSRALFDPRMDEQSVLLLNFGLHYVQNINFTQYQELIQDVISLIKRKNVYAAGKVNSFKGHVIWRTTTAMSREKYGDPAQHVPHAKVLRFLTNQRSILFNAFANSHMCKAGVDVIDVFPLTDSYPKGTGLPGKQYDGVHYTDNVFRSVEQLLSKFAGLKPGVLSNPALRRKNVSSPVR